MEASDWENDIEVPQPPGTEFRVDHSKTILSFNTSEDLPFNQSINPYKGCEHGCSYCYARQTHSYLDLSPGLDFETKIYCKPDAAALLKKALGNPGYKPQVIAMGTNTDPYQPVESQLEITRDVLNMLRKHRHPVSIVTKGALIERDIDILEEMAQQGLVQVFLSLTTMDNHLKRVMEPRTASPARRLKTISKLSASGIPTGAMIAPVIPGLTEHELETLMRASAAAGAGALGYALLRLPFEVRDLFQDWLQTHFPDRATKVMSLIRQTREGGNGKGYDTGFRHRQKGVGPIADLIKQRFLLERRRLGLDKPLPKLRTDLFQLPSGKQLSLF